MKSSLVWIDYDHAKVFHVSDEKMERENMKAHHVDHHTHRREGDEMDNTPFFDSIAERLTGSSRVLILGPGIAKFHFFSRLRDRHIPVAKNVVGIETIDHPTDPQIASYAQRYFQKPVA